MHPTKLICPVVSPPDVSQHKDHLEPTEDESRT